MQLSHRQQLRTLSKTRGYLSVLLTAASSFSLAADSPFAQPLTSVQQIRGLTPERITRGFPIHVRGIVTTLSGWKNSFFVKDNTGSISVNRDEPGSKIRSGDLVDIEGIADPGLFAPVIVAKHVTLIGSSQLPYAPLVSFSRLQRGNLDSQWVAVRGVVRSAENTRIWEDNFLSLLVDTGNGEVRGLVLEYSGDPHHLLDAVIEMRGACGTAFNDRRQFVGVSLFVPSLASISVTVPGNPDPFQSPLRPLDSLLNFATDDIPRRIKVRGTVTYQNLGQNIYIQDHGRGLLINTASRTVLLLGSVIEAAGFAANGAYSPSLDDAIIRVVGHAAPVAPLALEPKNVIQGDNFGFTVPSDGALVRLHARLVAWTENSSENTLFLQDGGIAFNAVLETNHSTVIPKYAVGSVLQITGICEAHTGLGSGTPNSFRILPRSAADIVVLSHPSWWTAEHATTVLTAALAFTLGVLCWVAALRSRVKRQTQLIRSQLASLAAISIENTMLAQRAQDTAVAEERNQLAHELHDTLAGAFTGISMQLQAASDLAGSNEELRTACIGRADDLASYGLRNVREFVHSLTIGSANGFSVALEMRTLLISATAGTGTNGKFTLEGQERPLSAACSNTVLRVMQEALGNAQRYADAKNILVTLRFAKDVLSVTISDDGKGFIVDESMDKGFGLTGIQSRISRLSGRYSLTSSPGAGTEIFVELPYC